MVKVAAAMVGVGMGVVRVVVVMALVCRTRNKPACLHGTLVFEAQTSWLRSP